MRISVALPELISARERRQLLASAEQGVSVAAESSSAVALLMALEHWPGRYISSGGADSSPCSEAARNGELQVGC